MSVLTAARLVTHDELSFRSKKSQNKYRKVIVCMIVF